MKRIVHALQKLSRRNRGYAVLLLCAATAIALPAQTFTTLHSFDWTDGAFPGAGLLQATNGDLYGTTEEGGANTCSTNNGCGTIFKITASGALTTLYNFCPQSGCADGQYPVAGLVQATNGYLYGTTQYGGAVNTEYCEYSTCGTVFKVTPGGTLTTLYRFCSQGGNCSDGANPTAGLVQATNGDFYGTTGYGGANDECADGCGTIFKMTPSGTLTTLYNFCSQSGCTDGDRPEAGLVQAANGYLYGTTAGGGAHGSGTVFKITPGGTLTTVYSFCSQTGCPDGVSPSGLVQATNGDFYGTTPEFELETVTFGTVFKITPAGKLTTIHRFCQTYPTCTDGTSPVAGLIQATDGNLYGTSYGGGANSDGTVFEITPSGALTTLHTFDPTGYYPAAALVQATNGDLYGTTLWGGPHGTVFSLSVGLGQFVKTLPTSGKVGASVKILGTDLTGATSVTFNGTAAVFTVVAPSEIKTTVPPGATTGTVQVVTPSATLSSNVPFRVP